MSYLTWAADPASPFTRVTGKEAETKQTAGQSSLTSPVMGAMHSNGCFNYDPPWATQELA